MNCSSEESAHFCELNRHGSASDQRKGYGCSGEWRQVFPGLELLVGRVTNPSSVLGLSSPPDRKQPPVRPSLLESGESRVHRAISERNCPTHD